MAMMSAGLLVLRLVVGGILAAHGAQKLFGWWGGPGMKGWTGAMTRLRVRPAAPWAWISALAELAGGLAFAVGFLNPLPSFAIAGSMLVAIMLIHLPRGFFTSKGGYEFNLSLLAGAAAVALAGPGAYSLDSALRIRLPEPATLIVMTVLLIVGVGAAVLPRERDQAAESKAQTA